MNILYWTGLFAPSIGGIETFSLELIHGLRQRGHTVTVIAIHAGASLPDFTDYQGIPVYRFDFSRVLANRNVAEISRMLAQVRDRKRAVAPDVIHVNDSYVGLFFHLNTPTPTPSIYTLHGTIPYNARDNPLHVRMLREATRVVTVSQSVYDAMRPFTEIAPRMSVLLNGLTMPTLEPAPLPAEPHFLCIGRLVEEKGFDVALDAFALLLREHPHARLTVAGDGKRRPDLEAQARRLGIDGAVCFTGWVVPDDVPALLNTVSAVVMPSRWQEPFGLVALQSGQMARPALVTRVGGLPEIVLDGETGWVVESENPAALADAMRALMENPAEAARRGIAARRRAAQHFSGARMVDDYERLFADVLREAQTP